MSIRNRQDALDIMVEDLAMQYLATAALSKRLDQSLVSLKGGQEGLSRSQATTAFGRSLAEVTSTVEQERSGADRRARALAWNLKAYLELRNKQRRKG